MVTSVQMIVAWPHPYDIYYNFMSVCGSHYRSISFFFFLFSAFLNPILGHVVER